ncbi:MAG: NAD-dependent epimerase/dehydratase family protein [Anaerofustis sp.]
MLALVTGATGHIGYALVRELQSKGYRIRAFHLCSNTSHSLCLKD